MNTRTMRVPAIPRFGLGAAVLAASLLLGACSAWRGGPPQAGASPQQQAWPLGDARGSWYLPAYRVASWSGMDRIPGMPVRKVPRGEATWPLEPLAAPPSIFYRHEGQSHDLATYMRRQKVTGLLVLQNGRIVAEQYGMGRDAQASFLSFSMAKTVTSLLMGVALQRGHIASLDDPAQKYLPALAGSAYGQTRLRDLLRMSSGLVFTERYDGQDDVAQMSRAAATGRPVLIDVLRNVNERHAPAGTKFTYASAETEVLGRVLTAATGRSLAELTSEWLWQPMGAERDAFWITSTDGQERAWAMFNASLRDWGRLGWMMARDGQGPRGSVVPREYLLDATDVQRQPAAFAPGRATPYQGYGYQVWLLPQRERSFVLQGVHGQAVYVQPASGIVMVHTAVFDPASGRQDPAPWREREALWRGVLQSLGANPN